MQPNHLVGIKQRYIKLYFSNQTDLIKIRRELLKAVRRNREKENTKSYYMQVLSSVLVNNCEEISSANKSNTDQLEQIIDIR